MLIMFSLIFYTQLTRSLTPILRLYLWRRVGLGKEDPARLSERFGKPSLLRPDGPLVWAHAASVGEAISILPLLEALHTRRPDLQLLITTGTVTSARLLADRMSAGLIHQFVPIDIPNAVNFFLDYWRPDCVLWTESEFWPNLLTQINHRNIPIALINGRMSARSFTAWNRNNWRRTLIQSLLQNFILCLAQGKQDAARLHDLGQLKVHQVGNLKFAVPALPTDLAVFAEMQALIGHRPLWLAASIHPGEILPVLTAHARLCKDYPDLLTIIVPRHPVRGNDFVTEARTFYKSGAVWQRSHGENITPDGGGIYIADTMGELGLWYRLASIVFMGGSLINHGGQNPIEAAKLEAAILHGPHMENFAEIVTALKECGGAWQVADGAALVEALAVLLTDNSIRSRLIVAAQHYVNQETQVLENIMTLLDPLLPASSA